MAKLIFPLTFGALLATHAIAPAQTTKNVTAIERAQLPTYCYAQFVDEKLAGQPGYSMPRSCGSWMNHLCAGHVSLIRARSPSRESRERRSLASQAISSFNYTLQHMTEDCPLRGDVNAALLQAKAIAGRSK